MRIVIDREKCQGHNRCFAEAPALFGLDNELKSVALLDSVPAELEVAAQVRRP